MATKLENAHQLPRRSTSQSENDTPTQNFLKTSFLRRFSRLSAKTRSKYRNELRRSNSLLDLSRSESIVAPTPKHSDDTPTQNNQTNDEENGEKLTDWIGRRLRNRSDYGHGRASSQDPSRRSTTMPSNSTGCTYVGDTLLKQKPRLRVRNIANKNTAGKSTDLTADLTDTTQDTTSIDTTSLEHDYDPANKETHVGDASRGRSSSASRTTGNSGSELSDMEQVLFRAARLRSRRVRSASNETRATDRTSQLDNYSFQTEKTGGQHSGHFDDSDSHPGDDDSFLIYGSCAKTYNQRIESTLRNMQKHTGSSSEMTGSNSELPELISLSTEYDPSEQNDGSSSGYGGSAGSTSGSQYSDQSQKMSSCNPKLTKINKNNEKHSRNCAETSKTDDLTKTSDPKKLVQKLLRDRVPENISPQEITVNRIETNQNTAEQNDKCDKPSLFYVALVGNDKKVQNSNYRVRSGYTDVKKSNSMSEVRRCSSSAVEGDSSKAHRTRLQRGTPMRGSLPVNFTPSRDTSFNQSHETVTSRDKTSSRDGHDVTQIQTVPVTSQIRDPRDPRDTRDASIRRGSNGSNASFTIKPDNIKVTESNKKDEWKITIKISREKDESDDYRTTASEAESVPGRHTIIREARVKKKLEQTQKVENQTQTSPQGTRATSPKTPESDSEPCLVPHILNMPPKPSTLPHSMTHTALQNPVNSFNPRTNIDTNTPKTHDHKSGTGSTDQNNQARIRNDFKSGPGGRKDVLPDMPRRCYLTRMQHEHARTNNIHKPKNEFKSILNKWQDRCHLSRAASVDGLHLRSGTFSGTSSRRTSQSSFSPEPVLDLTSRNCQQLPNHHLSSDLTKGGHSSSASSTSGVVSPTSDQEKKVAPVQKLPPLDSGPIFSRNRFQRSSSLNRFGSENSLGNKYLTSKFDQVGDMGRYSYRPGPIGWKPSNY